jgi:hypothetical protein
MENLFLSIYLSDRTLHAISSIFTLALHFYCLLEQFYAVMLVGLNSITFFNIKRKVLLVYAVPLCIDFKLSD